ncbi:LysR substrate binding domain protein [compost metagenome]
MYPKLAIDVRVKPSSFMVDMLESGEVDLAITTIAAADRPHIVLRTSPTLWYCAADYHFQAGEPIPLVVMDDPSPFRAMAIKHLDDAGIPWRIAYVASTLSAVRAACKAGLGITVRPIEMMSPDLRVLGATEGLPALPDTQYSLCKDPQCGNELAMAIFSAMQNGNDSYSFSGPGASLQDDACLVDDEE